jgi:hypothetical protein
MLMCHRAAFECDQTASDGRESDDAFNVRWGAC